MIEREEIVCPRRGTLCQNLLSKILVKGPILFDVVVCLIVQERPVVQDCLS